MAYNELETRGSADFPISFFYIDETHPRYEMSAHWHAEVEIIRVLEGEFRVKLDSREYTAKTGDVVFVNPETVHQGIPHKCIYECIVFHIDTLCTQMRSCNGFIEGVLRGEYAIDEFFPCEEGGLTRSAARVFDSFKNKGEGYRFEAVSALYDFLGDVFSSHKYSSKLGGTGTGNKKNILKLKKVLGFIRSNYDRQITLSDMAKTVDMSPKYFGAFFKGMTGKTPFEYLCEYRVEKAARKLLEANMSVTEIAFSCGFGDLSYFIKTFKKTKHVSPLAYRKNGN